MNSAELKAHVTEKTTLNGDSIKVRETNSKNQPYTKSSIVDLISADNCGLLIVSNNSYTQKKLTVFSYVLVNVDLNDKFKPTELFGDKERYGNKLFICINVSDRLKELEPGFEKVYCNDICSKLNLAPLLESDLTEEDYVLTINLLPSFKKTYNQFGGKLINLLLALQKKLSEVRDVGYLVKILELEAKLVERRKNLIFTTQAQQ